MPRVASPNAPPRQRVGTDGAAADSRAQAQLVVEAGVRGERAERPVEAGLPGHAQSRAHARTDPRAPSRDAPRRLLIPIDATDRSRWALRYALARRDPPVHVDLLFVAEPVTSLEVLRFRTQADIADFQNKSAQWLLEDAAQPLAAAGLSVKGHFREGDVASQIVETAEQLGADAIVMPPPHPLWLNFLTRGIVRKVLRRTGATPIVHVDRDGQAIELRSPVSVAH
ncbi:MAG: universal stress protein [Burkholderiales bacterium]